jgi:hypothetical protein
MCLPAPSLLNVPMPVAAVVSTGRPFASTRTPSSAWMVDACRSASPK